MAELFALHSWVRYGVLLAAVVALVVAAAGLAGRGDERAGRISMAVFAGVLDLQVLLGIVLLVLWPFYPMLIGHIVMMVLAAVAAHAGASLARRRPGRAPAIRLATAALVLILVVGGIMAIQRPIL
jgi:class 3 adenylate cyclase